MKKVLFIIAMFASSCTTAKISQKVIAVEPGMTKAQLIKILGTPGNRQFRDDCEAWQYCSTGFSSDLYYIIWLRGGVVTGSNTYTGYGNGNCNRFYRSVNWKDMPDKVIEIRHEDL